MTEKFNGGVGAAVCDGCSVMVRRGSPGDGKDFRPHMTLRIGARRRHFCGAGCMRRALGDLAAAGMDDDERPHLEMALSKLEGTLGTAPSGAGTEAELQHRLDAPKLCKVDEGRIYMVREEAEGSLAEIDEELRGSYEVRAIYATFAPADAL